jgi:nicotinamide mononucleotide transporter
MDTPKKHWITRYLDWVLEPWGIFWLVVCAGLVIATATGSVPFSWWETIGFVTGLLSVWLAAKEHIANWPIGLVNCTAFLVLFWQISLYGSAGTQVVYLVMTSYGWYMWLKGGVNQTELTISKLPLQLLLILTGLTALGSIAFWWLFTFTNNPSPLFDAVTTALSFAALYLLTIKVIENWWIWMAADVLFVLLYLTQGLYLTAILYVVFLGLCVQGYVGWHHLFYATHKLKREVA